MENEIEKLDGIEVQELDDQALEDAAGGAEGNSNCGCTINNNCEGACLPTVES